MRGGRRKGAGRKPNSGDARLELVREALAENREKLVRSAIKLATGKKPDRVVLCKLLDKVLPSLHSQQVEAEVWTTDMRAFPESDAEIDKKLLEYYAERIRKKLPKP